MRILWFVVLATCGRDNDFMDSKLVGRNEKVKVKIPRLKKIYNDKSWQKTFSTFDPTPAAFSGPKPGLPNPSRKMPILYALFHKFWTPRILCKICAETNHYASEINPRSKCTPKKLRGGET